MVRDCVIQHNKDDTYVRKGQWKKEARKDRHRRRRSFCESFFSSCKWVSSETFGVTERSFYEIENDYVDNLQVFDQLTSYACLLDVKDFFCRFSLRVFVRIGCFNCSLGNFSLDVGESLNGGWKWALNP